MKGSSYRRVRDIAEFFKTFADPCLIRCLADRKYLVRCVCSNCLGDILPPFSGRSHVIRMYILNQKSSILNDSSIQMALHAKTPHWHRYLDLESASALGGTLLIQQCLLWPRRCSQFAILRNGETLRVHHSISRTRVVS